MNLYNRQQFSWPNWANPYNAPLQGKRTTMSCQNSAATTYSTGASTYGMCSGNSIPTNGWDFVCPVGEICYSQTTNRVGNTPQDICCGRTDLRYNNCTPPFQFQPLGSLAPIIPQKPILPSIQLT